MPWLLPRELWGRPFADADIGRAAPNLGVKNEAVHLKSDIAAAKITTSG
jgi:hypothetical protein